MLNLENNNIKILLIEDDNFLRRIYVERFSAEGFMVLDADNGKAGLQKAFDEIPNIILLDLMLPDMTGLKILEELKAEKRTKNVPVIMLSNINVDDKIKKAMDLGAKDYLIKIHMTPSEVVDKVREYI
ncbi:hypothetical protein A2331_00730 [Candidatus Falkowbacteria bacterium RIFOXYB2_FULL_34_18]|uniref:Response regulatory domain-containing protein n=1 Tax=Candidatus Falkowbacteria bacterium RIFOXYD2_FULL_34_120 TaxID=1798007 RepID=A0A1F5TM27_9BACT|nr:MAG: hypothetical protein A2331_00730 [Candidatus Falkowbacteria bacterium RIFOXYB2_FULL_34_18]OGF29214.1 MAG: hypothetical protein A2500_06045 [Candidatus Falkowbacteria bacterium RIFOXYC12_FULL_34_55]OGF37752.1 MAG: hypothetical protein A2466_06375 [Candidatus Falkowbacteria bacterium RIFOXYC2_FULL_34_220]OGF38736.1 MAG: hypothetical protein A2515_01710 [Candidatus Falkowbacteria bacterium RIFOXYD12_FULL_34_57]OGF39970.1 MAG: hypothetical protein A2531_01965 [Candidatus Falkowbacteria bact